tara:strand:+ start:143 stop:481 length:339 start_codon:yes stop_codon:yes gene_type:complete
MILNFNFKKNSMNDPVNLQTPPKQVRIRKLSKIDKSPSTTNLLRIRNFRFAQQSVDTFFDDSDSSNIPTPTPQTNVKKNCNNSEYPTFEDSDTESESHVINNLVHKKLKISK